MNWPLIQKINKSVSLKINLALCFTFILGISSALLFTYFQLQKTLEDSDKQTIISKSNEMAVIYKKEGIEGVKSLFTSEKERLLNAFFMIQILDQNGNILFEKKSIQEKSFDFKNYKKEKNQLEDASNWSILKAADDEDRFFIYTQKISENKFLQIGKSSEFNEEILEEIMFKFFIIGSLSILMSLYFGVSYTRKLLNPLKNLLQTMQSIKNGEFSKRVSLPNTQDELFILSESFNNMVSKIEDLVKVMQDSLDNVAHDIRTPLTRVKAMAEQAILSQDTKSMKLALEECAEATDEIAGLIEQLFSISEAEAGTMSLSLESYSIDRLLREVIEVYEFVAADKLIELNLNVQPIDLVWTLDRKKIKQAVANLIDNAIKFSPPSKSIFIEGVIVSEQLKISVRDQGLGVDEFDILHIWDRLYRGDKSRSAKGLGLGLSIVKAIVFAHQGRVSAESAIEGGMKFTIFLNKKNNRNITCM